jgi:hypothetical protein
VPRRRGLAGDTADGGAQCSGPHIATMVRAVQVVLGGGWQRGRLQVGRSSTYGSVAMIGGGRRILNALSSCDVPLRPASSLS